MNSVIVALTCRAVWAGPSRAAPTQSWPNAVSIGARRITVEIVWTVVRDNFNKFLSYDELGKWEAVLETVLCIHILFISYIYTSFFFMPFLQNSPLGCCDECTIWIPCAPNDDVSTNLTEVILSLSLVSDAYTPSICVQYKLPLNTAMPYEKFTSVATTECVSVEPSIRMDSTLRLQKSVQYIVCVEYSSVRGRMHRTPLFTVSAPLPLTVSLSSLPAPLSLQ